MEEDGPPHRSGVQMSYSVKEENRKVYVYDIGFKIHVKTYQPIETAAILGIVYAVIKEHFSHPETRVPP